MEKNPHTTPSRRVALLFFGTVTLLLLSSLLLLPGTKLSWPLTTPFSFSHLVGILLIGAAAAVSMASLPFGRLLGSVLLLFAFVSPQALVASLDLRSALALLAVILFLNDVRWRELQLAPIAGALLLISLGRAEALCALGLLILSGRTGVAPVTRWTLVALCIVRLALPLSANEEQRIAMQRTTLSPATSPTVAAPAPQGSSLMTLLDLAINAPSTYLEAVGRSFVRGLGIEAVPFERTQLTSSFPDVIQEHPTSSSGSVPPLEQSAAPFAILIVLGAALSATMLLLQRRAIPSRGVLLLASPWVWTASQALCLTSSPIMFLPAGILFLLVFALLPATAAPLLRQRDPNTFTDLRPGSILLLMTVATVALLIGMRLLFLLTNNTPPSWDESHYLTGAYQLLASFESSSLSTVFTSMTTLLQTKPPLVSILAAIQMWLVGESLTVALMTQWTILLALAWSSYLLFGLIFPRSTAGIAVALLLGAPMVTGLTHRFYTENLLLAVTCAYLFLLLRKEQLDWKHAVGIGCIGGLGLLTKTTFASVILPPSLLVGAIWIHRCWHGENRWRSLLKLGLKVLCLTAVICAVASPWYIPNLEAARAHGLRSFWSLDCAYPTVRAFFSMLSSGPGLLQVALALVGALPLVALVASPHMPKERSRALICLALVAFATMLTSSLAVNKATRFSVTWLPFFSVVATIGLCSLPLRVRTVATFATLLVTLTLLAHNSFRILGSTALSRLDLTPIHYEFPLNVPDWFADNFPRDERDFALQQLTSSVHSALRKGRLQQGTPVALLTADCLLFNHNTVGLFGRQTPIWYLPWYAKDAAKDPSVEFIILISNAKEMCRGRFFSDVSASYRRDIEQGLLPFRPVQTVPGVAQTEYHIFQRY